MTPLSRQTKPLISISIPVLNEEDNIDALYARLCRLADHLADRCDFEFMFSDNQSSDSTWSKLEGLSTADARVRAIRFSKNVGFQRSILANYLHTRGDAVMQIDADLQDPPELLETFLDKWQEGYQVIYGIRAVRREGALVTAFRRFGYWSIDLLSEHPIPRDAGDFRLIDRSVIKALLQVKTAEPYLRGMIAAMGFRQIGVPYARQARIAGSSKFGIGRLLGLGFTAVFNHSVVPLRIASLVGIGMLALSVFGTIYYLILRLLEPGLPEGLASIHMLVLFGIGLQSLLLGIIGEYILRIYLILRSEPIALIENSLNLASSDLKL